MKFEKANSKPKKRSYEEEPHPAHTGGEETLVPLNDNPEIERGFPVGTSWVPDLESLQEGITDAYEFLEEFKDALESEGLLVGLITKDEFDRAVDEMEALVYSYQDDASEENFEAVRQACERYVKER